MDGTIKVLMRTPDGTELNMNRWTNTHSRMFTRRGWIEKDPSVIDEYLDSWRMMKSDWDRNGPRGPFEQLMTDSYFPTKQAAPISYGLIFVDWVNNRIYDSRGYTDLSRFSDLDLSVNGWDAEVSDVDDDKDFYIEDISWLISQGRVVMNRIVKEGKERRVVSTSIDPSMKLTELRRIISKFGPRPIIHFSVDMRPWDYRRFDESAAGTRALKAAIDAVGWPFTKKDEKAWKDYIKDKFG